MNVLHLPTATCGNAWAIAKAERKIGVYSDVLVKGKDLFDFSADISLGFEKVNSKIVRCWRLSRAFFEVRKRYDVFHFNSGTTLFNLPSYGLHHLDLPFYPRDKKVFVTFSGCDARQKYPTIKRTNISACHNALCYKGACNSGKKDKQRRAAIAKMARYACHCWAQNPDLMRFLPEKKSSFIPYAVEINNGEHITWREPGRKLRILHAPTQREAKGTQHILAALERLKKSHPDSFELVLIENIRHGDALRCYASADLIIDQLLVGWYGTFAVEAMLMHKPVIARIAENDLRFVPSHMAQGVAEAIINAGPDSLYEVLIRCVEDRPWLKEHAAAGQEFAHRWHDPNFIASLTVQQYESAVNG